MIKNIINEFREKHGRERVNNWNGVLSDFCVAHSTAMVNLKDLYHTPPHYLQNYAEIVAWCDFRNNWDETLRCLIFEVIGNSPEHKKILLESEEMGYGIMSDSNKVYITIRGR